EVAANDFSNGQDAFGAGDGDDDHLGLSSASGAQRLEARAVAVEDLDAKSPDERDLSRVVIDQRHAVATGAQQAGDDLTEAAIAEHDDVVRFDLFGLLLGDVAGMQARSPQLVEDEEQDGGRGHRKGDHHQHEIDIEATETTRAVRELQHDKAELAGLA